MWRCGSLSWYLAINADVLLACDAIPLQSPPPRANVDKERMIKPFKRASVCMGGYWELCFESELETGLMLLLWS